MQLDPGSDGSGGVSTSTLPWGLTSPHTQSPFSTLLPSSRPHSGPQHLAGNRLGDGWQGRLSGMELAGLWSASWAPPAPPPPPPGPDTPSQFHGFGEEPGEEQRREGQERTQREGRGALRLSLRQRFFILFPFSYVKSARKLSSLFTRVSSVSWGRGQGNSQAWHPSLQLKVASYCLETWVSF